MTACFADSAYFIALLNAKDVRHHEACAISRALSAQVFTTTWILSEVASALAGTRTRRLVSEFIDHLKTSKQVSLISATQESFDTGLELYRQRPDKEWSVVDCISFSVMEQYELTDALTTDKHFVQAGFNALMR